jgi:general secretion pathway protein A
VRHRLDVAGATQDIFTAGALREVHRCAGGIPRLINVICDRALLGAYSRMKRRVDPALVRRASHEIRGRRRDDRRPLPLAMAGGAVALAAVVAAVAGWQLSTRPDAPALARRDAGVAIEAAPARPAVRMAGGPSNAVAAPVATADAAGSDRRADGPAGDGGAGDAMRPAPGAGSAAQTPAPVNAANPPPRRDGAPGASSDAAGAADVGVPSLHALLVQHADVTTTEDAFDRLFARWAVAEPPADTSPCAWARENGLRCEVQLGSWALLAVMNRPAILSLVDDAGQRHHVLATALAGDRVELQIGAAPVTLSLGEVTPHWMGEYLLLWRPNPQADELMLPGMRGPGVRWLRESLSRLSPDDADTVNVANADYYDASLTDQVREFQRQARLSADGKAGLRTLIALNSALNPADTPSLSGGPFGSEALDRAPWVSGPPIADGRSALDARRSRE